MTYEMTVSSPPVSEFEFVEVPAKTQDVVVGSQNRGVAKGSRDVVVPVSPMP